MSRSQLPMLLLGAVFVLLAFLGGVMVADMDVGTEHAEHTELYTCSMHPQIRNHGPGDCPICGMDLVPVGEGASSAPPTRIMLSDRARALAELQTIPVQRMREAGELRLLGRVEPDESSRKDVTAWVGGRIDRLYVRTTGEQVRRGQTVASLYSPEVYSAHQDLIAAREQVERLAGGSPTAAAAARSALTAARDRLRLLGVPADEVTRMEEADEPTQGTPIRSPFGGTVIDRVATEGAYVQTGAVLYRLADLDRVWIELDAYESDLPRIDVGMPVTIAVEALPGELFEGQVAFVDPTLDPQRRTAGVRVEVPNPDGRLRPGLFAEAAVHTGEAAPGTVPPLVIPATAPLFTGKRAVVYVEVRTEGEVAYEPRTVRLGPKMGNVYPVVAGLLEGEHVVQRGAFALDADLQIHGGPSMMTRPDDQAPSDEQLVPLTDTERAHVAPVVETYLAVQRALAEDDVSAARSAAESLVAAIDTVALTGDAAASWRALGEPLRNQALRVSGAADIDAARVAFEPLSDALRRVLATFGNPTDGLLHVAYCPMAFDNEGASWVQEGRAIDNSYFGDAMRTCGEVRTELAPGGFLAAGSGD